MSGHQIVLITGAGGGIGAAAARAFAADGHGVAAADINGARLRRWQAQIAADQLLTVAADVRDRSSVEAMVARTVRAVRRDRRAVPQRRRLRRPGPADRGDARRRDRPPDRRQHPRRRERAAGGAPPRAPRRRGDPDVVDLGPPGPSRRCGLRRDQDRAARPGPVAGRRARAAPDPRERHLARHDRDARWRPRRTRPSSSRSSPRRTRSAVSGSRRTSPRRSSSSPRAAYVNGVVLRVDGGDCLMGAL